LSRANVGHYLIAVEGLALQRTWWRQRESAERRIEELRAFSAPGASTLGVELELPEDDVRTGYARWASSYDLPRNPLIRLEEPAVRAIIDRLPVGRALDAACGTGRHARYLAARGHQVIGVDATPEMLELARRDLPGVDLRVGDLRRLPLADGSVDLAVCALALTHFESLDEPIVELTRVVRRGGRVILSDHHPTLTAIGGTAFFFAADGSAGVVRSHVHRHSDYVAAFRRAGLEIRDCVEPLTGEEEAVLMSGGMADLAPEAFSAAFVGLPQALIWELEVRSV